MPFYSGPGSRDEAIVSAYVKAAGDFLRSLGGRGDAVDLGCGDFAVGSQLRASCGRYSAVDAVAELIAFNRTKYARLDVDFEVLDIVNDPLPAGQVAFLRQVLQHLSNADISKVVEKIAARFKYLVLTEHVPGRGSFTPNADIASGAATRLSFGSGVVLTSAPFNLKPVEERVICECPQHGGIIRTTIYTLC